MRIRRVKLAGWLGTLKALHAECFPLDAEPNWERSEWWVGLSDEGKPIAFAGCHLHEPDNFVYLSRAGVLEHRRGKGLQRRLIAVRVARAAKLGAAGVYTFVVRDNFASANNLIRSGFKLFRPGRKWGGKDSLYFYVRFR